MEKMENNKFNRFYSKKSLGDLLNQILSHRITGSTLDKDWYEALIIHLTARNLNADMRQLYEKILNTPPEVLKQEEEHIAIAINNLSKIEFGASNMTLKKSNINAAGKSLKTIVYAALIMIIFSIIGVFISISSKDFETIQFTYLFIGIVALVFNIIILISLYKAGDDLENS